jgi:hypothetical protein
MKTPRSGEAGFSLMEITATATGMFVALMALAGVIVVVSHQREQLSVEKTVLSRAQSLLEEIKGTAPGVIESGYDGRTYPIEGISGAGANGTVLSVTVDSTDAKLLAVSVIADWIAAGAAERLTLRTDIYDP